MPTGKLIAIPSLIASTCSVLFLRRLVPFERIQTVHLLFVLVECLVKTILIPEFILILMENLNSNYKNHFFFSGLLKRIAELFASLPDNPLEQYQKRLAEFSDTGIQKTEAEGVSFMSDKPITRMVNHPYVKSSPETHSHFGDTETNLVYSR